MATATYILLIVTLSTISSSAGDTYVAKIATDQHVNEVDNRFMSFTIDPKYLFSTSEKYSKECTCMASFLTPAYLRIAGPSTPHINFHNTTISLNDVDFEPQQEDFEVFALDGEANGKVPIEVTTKKLTVTHRVERQYEDSDWIHLKHRTGILKEWRKFIQWAKSTGFNLVFALNNEERTVTRMWDPNTALKILTVAKRAKVGHMYWELGYECSNQSIEEYLNDLETLRVIIDTFPPGRTGEWKVVGGDVTKCLQAESKNDFKDYIMQSNEMMDAIFLNGNSSTYELERMTKKDRLQLLRHLAYSRTPLWLTEPNQRQYNQLERAVDWLSSLGYSAKNGFSINYRELLEEELYEPTMSFYMALLFKNLVGNRVLNVEMEPDEAILFAHCTSLQHKPVAGAVTLFGLNMEDETARFSLKLSKREEGGDVMQFILGYDHSGNIVVNGRPMYYEGDITPVLKRIRPYRTLLINLPAKSFGFWVLANTRIEACQAINDGTKTLNETDKSIPEIQKVKRSVDEDFDDDYANVAELTYDFVDYDTFISNNALKKRINDINRDLDKIQSLFQSNKYRIKRDGDDYSFEKNKFRRQALRPKIIDLLDMNLAPRELLDNILQKAKQSVGTLKNKSLRNVNRILNIKKNKVNKRHSRTSKGKIPNKYLKPINKTLRKSTRLNNILKKKSNNLESAKNIKNAKNGIQEKNNKKISDMDEIPKKIANKEEKTDIKKTMENKIFNENTSKLEPQSRKRRHLMREEEEEELSAGTDELKNSNKGKVWKILKDMKETSEEHRKGINSKEDSKSEEGIILTTELSGDTAIIKVTDSGKGVIKASMTKLITVLEELKDNINRVWGGLSLID